MQRLLLALITAAALLLPASALALPPLQDVTDQPPGGTTPEHIGQGWLSADGNCTVFVTAEKLLPGDPNGRKDIYERCGTTLTLVSIGPAQNADTTASPFLEVRDVSAHGCVLFAMTEKLTDDDADTEIDLYKRCGSSIELVSQGRNAAGANQYTQGNLSRDGSCVVFPSHEQMTADDTDLLQDLYERCGTTTRRVSRGQDPTSGNTNAGYYTFEGVSDDGSCVVFTTSEQIAAEDTDSENDLYERCGSTTTKLSPGNGAFGVRSDGISADGSCAEAETAEQWAPGDTDQYQDIYRICGSQITLISTGPSGGNASQDATSEEYSRDMSCFEFDTDERITPDDTDSANDVFKRCDGRPVERVSVGPNGGNAQIDASDEWFSGDGRCIVFSTDEHITADDTDSGKDFFRRCGSTTVRVSGGAGTGNGSGIGEVSGLSYDGARVLLQTNERLTADDTDDSTDLYEYASGTLSRITPPDTTPDHYGSLPFGMSDDGSKVLFSRYDRVLPSDTDDLGDLYLATLAPPAETADASEVTESGATLNGFASGQAGVKVHFEYGPTAAYGSSAPEADVPAAAGRYAISTSLTGLAAGTTYHFRLVATGPGGTSTIADATFTTAAAPGDNAGGGDRGEHGQDGPPAPPASFAGVLLRPGSVRAKRGVAPVKVACPGDAQGNCAGTLTLALKGRKIGSGKFTIAAGSSQLVRVRIASSVKARTLKVKATAVAHDARNVSVTTAAKVTLRR